jgi:hypothetical protein
MGGHRIDSRTDCLRGGRHFGARGSAIGSLLLSVISFPVVVVIVLRRSEEDAFLIRAVQIPIQD